MIKPALKCATISPHLVGLNFAAPSATEPGGDELGQQSIFQMQSCQWNLISSQAVPQLNLILCSLCRSHPKAVEREMEMPQWWLPTKRVAHGQSMFAQAQVPDPSNLASAANIIVWSLGFVTSENVSKSGKECCPFGINWWAKKTNETSKRTQMHFEARTLLTQNMPWLWVHKKFLQKASVWTVSKTQLTALQTELKSQGNSCALHMCFLAKQHFLNNRLKSASIVWLPNCVFSPLLTRNVVQSVLPQKLMLEKPKIPAVNWNFGIWWHVKTVQPTKKSCQPASDAVQASLPQLLSVTAADALFAPKETKQQKIKFCFCHVAGVTKKAFVFGVLNEHFLLCILRPFEMQSWSKSSQFGFFANAQSQGCCLKTYHFFLFHKDNPHCKKTVDSMDAFVQRFVILWHLVCRLLILNWISATSHRCITAQQLHSVSIPFSSNNGDWNVSVEMALSVPLTSLSLASSLSLLKCFPDVIPASVVTIPNWEPQPIFFIAFDKHADSQHMGDFCQPYQMHLLQCVVCIFPCGKTNWEHDICFAKCALFSQMLDCRRSTWQHPSCLNRWQLGAHPGPCFLPSTLLCIPMSPIHMTHLCP